MPIELTYVDDKEKSGNEEKIQDIIKEKRFCCVIKACDDWSISWKIGGTMLAVLFSSILLMAVVTIIMCSHFQTEVLNLTSKPLNDEEREQLVRISLKLSEALDANFAQFSFDTKFLGVITGELESGELKKQGSDNWRNSYDYGWISFLTRPLSGGAELDTSVWYHKNINEETVQELSYLPLKEEAQDTSVLDFYFAGQYHDNYEQIYYGTELGLFRQYPWSSLEAFGDQNSKKIQFNEDTDQCEPNNLAQYEPRCRTWYTNAKNLLTGQIGFTEPYKGAGEGAVCITVYTPVYEGNNLKGVIATDPRITKMKNLFDSVDIMENGYAFTVDNKGMTIFHKNVDLTKGEHIAHISDSHLETSSLLETGFFTEESGLVDFKKNGNTWYLAWKQTKTIYRVGVVVAQEDVESAATEAGDLIRRGINGMIVAIVIVLLIIMGIVFYLTNQISNLVTEPVLKLTEVCESIHKGDLDVQFQNDENATCSDVLNLGQAFKAMLTSIRFGSEAYYSGDVGKAQSCFEEALLLFQKVDNKRGIGISQNNLGSVYAQKQDFAAAHKAYINSIELAQMEVAQSQDKVKAQKVLSSRMGNRAVCFMQQGDLESAEKLLHEAMDIDKKVRNGLGFVVKSGTLAKVYMKRNPPRMEDANQVITQSEELLSSEETFMQAKGVTPEDYIICQTHSRLNRAEFALYQENFDEAWKTCDEELTKNKICDFGAQSHALRLLLKIYEEMGCQAALHALSDTLGKTTRGVSREKDVLIVYDYSGSMSGGRHRRAMGSLQDIFYQHLNPDDEVGFIHFNHTVEVDVTLKAKSANEEKFRNLFMTLTSPLGGTSFFDALDTAMNELSKSKSKREKWIIALTDGEDNNSKTHFNEVCKRLENENVDALIIVCVGVEENVLKICNQMASATPKGKVLDAKNNEAIEDAFQKVAQMLEGHIVLEKY